MPAHDWTRVAAGIFHAFHVSWVTAISHELNGGILPSDYYALPEQIAGGIGPDGLTLHRPRRSPSVPSLPQGGVALADAPLTVTHQVRSDASRYAQKANAIEVRHVSRHRVVAMIEVISPGNKESRHGLAAFMRKAHEMLASGVHLLVVDLFPPTPRDPQGLHRQIWGEDPNDTSFLTDQRPLCASSYIGGAGAAAFIEPFGVGEVVPRMPLFLTSDYYVYAPLEATYNVTFAQMPRYWQDVVLGGDEDP